MNKVFLSRDNTSKLYKGILEENKLQALPKKSKELIVNNLVGNMKEIYKHLDFSQINDGNLNRVLNQFNNMCIQETTRNLKNSELFSGEDNQIARVKFARDFNSTPQKQVKFLERPTYTNSNTRNTVQNSDNGFDNYASISIKEHNSQGMSSLDSMFKPMTSNNDSNFGYLNSRSDGLDINKQMEMINKMRQNETTHLNKRPPTPEFLKSQKTQQRKDYEEPPNNNYQQNSNNNFQASNANNFQENNGNSNELDSYASGDNFFSFEDMNKPLVNTEIVEDNASFEERLKRLQSDRDSFNPELNSSEKKTLESTQDIERNQEIERQKQNIQYQQQRQEQQRQEQQRQEQQRQEQQRQEQQRQQQQRQQRELNYQRQEELDKRRNEELEYQRQQEMQMKNQENNRRIIEERSQNINPNLEQLLSRLNKLENSNSNKRLQELEAENKSLKNELEQVSSLKERISKEFSELTRKNEMVESNIQIMNQRELELSSRENNINQLIQNYKQILNSRFYQMNVSSKDNLSKYTYFFNPVDNVMSIKIISYSLPQARYNIDINNNLLKYKVNDEEKELKLPKGKYSIDNLLEYINDKTNLNFELTISQKVKVSSSEKFSLESNNLTRLVLGIQDFECIENEEKYEINATNTWDLRLHDKLFLYFTNINDDPVSIVYFNGNCESQIQFEEPIELSQLDIELRDENGNLYDFNNLKHTINLQLELTNQFNSFVSNVINSEI